MRQFGAISFSPIDGRFSRVIGTGCRVLGAELGVRGREETSSDRGYTPREARHWEGCNPLHGGFSLADSQLRSVGFLFPKKEDEKFDCGFIGLDDDEVPLFDAVAKGGTEIGP